MATLTRSRAHRYSNLTGDTDADTDLLGALNRLAHDRHQTFVISSGYRSDAEQVSIWNSGVRPAAKPKALGGPGSNHSLGHAADVSIGGKPFWSVISPGTAAKYGLTFIGGGTGFDPPHVELKPGAKKDSGGGGLISGIPDPGDLYELGAKGAKAVGGEAADLAGGIVDWFFETIGKAGAKILLTIGFVWAGMALAGIGVARALGVRKEDIASVAMTAATKGAK